MNILSLFESDYTTVAELGVLLMSFIYIVDSLLDPLPYVKKALNSLRNFKEKISGDKALINVLIHGAPLGSHATLSNASKELIRKSVKSKSIRPLYRKVESNVIKSTYRLRKIAASNKLSTCYSVGQSVNSHNVAR